MTAPRLLMTLLALVTAMLLPAHAAATPGDGVSAVVLSQSAADGYDYITREITIAPGGSTGWHWHQGRVFGVIIDGTLTHVKADCTLDGIYNAGDPIVEASGPDNVHIGRNLGPAPLVMWILYINPAGSPLSDDAADPACV